MPKNRKEVDSLVDIREAIYSITEYIEGFDYDSFIFDKKTKDAVVHNLEIIGEATKNLSNNIRSEYDHVPWKKLAGVRDRLTHSYFDINYEIVWDIVKNELPKLLGQINEILTALKL
jgi:uncharacterized protein with HEPN domain